MSTDAVILFLSMLTVCAQLAVLGLAVSPGLRAHVAPSALSLAWVVATVATLGSLYFSQVAHFIPCRLCWIQRGFMYPLVLVFAVALWRRWVGVWRIGLTASALGATVSAWHMLVERYPSLETSTCDPDNPCSLIWFKRFGYITIPTMAFSAFILIATLMLVARARIRSDQTR